MAFIDDIKKIYLDYGVQFPDVEITPFMENFIERTYNALLKASSPKYSDSYNIAELFISSYEKSLIDNARISFSDKISNARFVGGNCECVEFILNDGTTKKIPLPLSKVATGFKKNSSMRSSAGSDGPKGLQDIIDGFQIFWEKSEWSDDIVEGTSKPEVHTIECGVCDKIENTTKLIVNGNTDESKEELKNAFTKFFTPRHTYKAQREIALFAILRELSQSLEKHFNGYSGEYYGFDTRDKKKVVKLEWNGIKYSTNIVPRDPIGETLHPDDYDYRAIDSRIVSVHIGDPKSGGFSLHNAKNWIAGNTKTGRLPLKNFINLTLYEPSGKATSTFIKDGSANHPKTGNKYYTMLSETTGRSLEYYETITVFNDGHIELFQTTYDRGQRRTITAEQKVLSKLKDVNYAFSGSDVLILEGKAIDLSNKQFLQKDKSRPKTSIGFHKDKIFIAVTVPSGKHKYTTLNGKQNWPIWQNTLLSINPDATWISFDGGGSSTFVADSTIKLKAEGDNGRAISTVLSWEE